MFSFLSVVGATSDCSWMGWLLMFAVGIAGISLHCSLLLTCWTDFSAPACWISLTCWKDFMWARLAVTHLGLLSHWPVTNSIADNHQKGKFSSSDLFPKFLLKDVVGVWSKGDFMVTGSPACTSPRQLFRKKHSWMLYLDSRLLCESGKKDLWSLTCFFSSGKVCIFVRELLVRFMI